jgi:hypothetical protein
MKPFHEFFSHGGISAIMKPFHEFFFHTVGYRLSRSLFTNFLSHGGIHKMHNLGEDSFHIYHKEYLHRICLIKNLAS